MPARLWSPDAPERCACAGTYRLRLNAHGKLIKSREPAWSMMEQTRDPGCLQEQVRDLAKFYGTEYQHHGDSRKSGKGFPDCQIWAPGRGSAFAELKRFRRGYPDNRDDPTPAQVARLTTLQQAGHPVYLVRSCCLLVGAVDELFAEFLGVPCLYVKGRPDGHPAPAIAADDRPASTAVPAATVRPPRPDPVLPGAEPGEAFRDAVGYVVPMPDDDQAAAAVREVEGWLRDAGFPPTSVPFPFRIVAGDAAVDVQVRVGLARLGFGDRVWRRGTPARPFPRNLLKTLRAVAVVGATSERVAWLIEKQTPEAVAHHH